MVKKMRGIKMTINEKIKFYRAQLNHLISKEANYDEIYKLSIRIDDLIINYYKQQKKTS